MTSPSNDDLSRLRAIAEEGRSAPLLGGRYLLLWGVIVAVAASLHWSVVNDLLGWPSWSLAIIWFALSGLGAIIGMMFRRGDAPVRAVGTIGNQVERAVWIAGGVLLGTISVALLLRASLAGDPEAFGYFAVMPPLTFGIYAVALMASAVAGAVPRLKPFAWLSLALAALTIFLLDQPALYLVVAAGAVLVSIVPGMLQLRAERGAGRP